LLAELQHAETASSGLGDLIGRLESDASSLDDAQGAVLAKARKDHDRAVRLPSEFVREKAEHSSHSYHAWAEARAKSDFWHFAPLLKKHLSLAKQEAEYLGWGDRSYDYMLDQHDPGMTTAEIGRLFDELKTDLVPLARSIVSSPLKPDSEFLRGFGIDAQREFAKEVVKSLGFDFEKGRLDVSTHPFCSGSGADVRMTTRYDVNNPLDSLFSAIHEAGHGMYEQGLPGDFPGTALSIAAGMGTHESQSRLWENQVARSIGFWRHFEPRFRAAFPTQLEGVSSESLYLAINAVAPTLIRVDSDEVTYNLHILLRFDLEKRLFSGELSVADLPQAWNEASRDLLGMEPKTDAEGVLQDVHWSTGAFGYFPSYCLGNMLSAQLWYRALQLMPDLEYDFARGDYSRLLGWLRSEIHAHGRRYTLLDLTRRATGADLSPQPLLRYLRERYGALYLRASLSDA